MIKRLLIFVYVLVNQYLISQNLVPNYSFELLDSCPTVNDLYLAKPWCGVSGDEDLFNACGNPTVQCSVPYTVGNMFQYARTGNGFMALTLYVETGPLDFARNYGHVQLKQPLQINKKYLVKYFINLNNNSQYAISNIDALFIDTQPNCNINSSASFTTIVATPQIKNKNGILTDTLNWVEVCDTMTSVGNESFFILGNFNTNSNTNVIRAYPSAGRLDCIVQFDDVFVEELNPAKCINDTTICNQSDSVLMGLNQTESATYSWQPSIGLSCSFCPNPKALPQVTTKYILTKQDCNIITKDSVTITVKNDCNSLASIPNVFTPNNDDVNDTFKIELGEVTNIDFKLYNRWGNLIYETSNKTILWDGRTTSGESCMNGVYFYTLKYTDVNGESQSKNGYVSLFR